MKKFKIVYKLLKVWKYSIKVDEIDINKDGSVTVAELIEAILRKVVK